jgi:hypothetical protein
MSCFFEEAPLKRSGKNRGRKQFDVMDLLQPLTPNKCHMGITHLSSTCGNFLSVIGWHLTVVNVSPRK